MGTGAEMTDFGEMSPITKKWYEERRKCEELHYLRFVRAIFKNCFHCEYTKEVKNVTEQRTKEQQAEADSGN